MGIWWLWAVVCCVYVKWMMGSDAGCCVLCVWEVMLLCAVCQLQPLLHSLLSQDHHPSSLRTPKCSRGKLPESYSSSFSSFLLVHLAHRPAPIRSKFAVFDPPQTAWDWEGIPNFVEKVKFVSHSLLLGECFSVNIRQLSFTLW